MCAAIDLDASHVFYLNKDEIKFYFTLIHILKLIIIYIYKI